MLKEILEDLEFISKVPKNAKPNFSDKSFTSTSEWFSTIKRRYKYEKGEKGMVYVSTLVENLYKIYKSLDLSSLKNLKEKVIAANIGLNNIICTYKIDEQPEVWKNYSTSLEKLENLVLEIDNLTKIKNSFFNHQPFIFK
jgi:hypothetical protein